MAKVARMAKGYWIVTVDVSDFDQYGEYSKLARPIMAKLGAKFLTRGGDHEIVEGAGHSRNVIIEFENYELAVTTYHSDAYQALIPLRTKAAIGNVVIVEGLDA